MGLFKMKIDKAELNKILTENATMAKRVNELLTRNTELVEEVRAAKVAKVAHEYKQFSLYMGPSDTYEKIVEKMTELGNLGWEVLFAKDGIRTDNGAPTVSLFCKRPK